MHNSATNFNMYSMYWKKQNGKVSAVMTSTVLDFFFLFFFFVCLFLCFFTERIVALDS